MIENEIYYFFIPRYMFQCFNSPGCNTVEVVLKNLLITGILNLLEVSR